MSSVFSHEQHQAEIVDLVNGNYRQMALITIDLSAAGFPSNGGARGLFEVEGNCLMILPRVLDFDGKSELVSSVVAGPPAARIYVRFNHVDNPWLPMSLVAGSLDFSAFIGTIARFWISIPNAVGGAKLYLAVTKGMVLAASGTTQGPTGGGYGTPTVSATVPSGGGGAGSAGGSSGAGGGGGGFSGGGRVGNLG